MTNPDIKHNVADELAPDGVAMKVTHVTTKAEMDAYHIVSPSKQKLIAQQNQACGLQGQPTLADREPNIRMLENQKLIIDILATLETKLDRLIKIQKEVSDDSPII